MGREVKRVALDFEWPESKVWEGFLNPHVRDCERCTACDGMGMSPWAIRIHEQWHGGSVPFHPTHVGLPPLTADSPILIEQATEKTIRNAWYYGTGPAAIRREAARLAELFNSYKSNHLTQAEIDILSDAGAFNDFKKVCHPDGSWHDRNGPITPEIYTATAISSHASVRYTPLLEALEETNGSYLCKECDGEGYVWISEEAKRRADEWTQTEPPEGEGWQLWETVSEGSPVSPVFATPEELAAWLAGPESSQRDSVTSDLTEAQWLKFLTGPGWAPSSIIRNGVMMSGVAGVIEA
jgi:hypothetical protein